MTNTVRTRFEILGTECLYVTTSDTSEGARSFVEYEGTKVAAATRPTREESIKAALTVVGYYGRCASARAADAKAYTWRTRIVVEG